MKYYLIDSYKCNLHKFVFIVLLLYSVNINILTISDNNNKWRKQIKMVLDQIHGQ